jgi:hypothetical protein
LPKCLMHYNDPAPWGHVAEWLRNGLQNRSPLKLCHRRNLARRAVSSIFSHANSIFCAAFCATARVAGTVAALPFHIDWGAANAEEVLAR